MDETQAIRRLRRGDLRGLTFLVTAYQVQALRTAFLLLGDRMAAEDVVQQQFIDLLTTLHTFDVSRPFAPWFMRGVVRAA